MTKIIADTTSCLSPEVVQKYGITVVPQVIVFGNETFLEGVNMDNAAFMQRLKASKELPKTAAPPVEKFSEAFQKFVPTGEPILCIHPSADVSGTIRSATVAAQDFPEADIRIIDTRTIASTLGTIVELAATWAAQGVGADTIEARIKDLSPRAQVYFMVPTLEYLARGGRIGGASALLGSVLQIKPILAFLGGRVDQFERERTYRRALERLKEIVYERISHDGSGYLTVLHAGVPDEARALAVDLGSRVNQPAVGIFDMPPAIVTHAGPGILGAGFFVKD